MKAVVRGWRGLYEPGTAASNGPPWLFTTLPT